MKEEKKPVYVKFFGFSFVKLCLILVTTELLFRWIGFGFGIDFALIRILLFSLSVSMIVSGFASFLPMKAGRVVVGFVEVLIPLYATFQLGIHNMMGNFQPIKGGGEMAGAVFSYIPQFFAQMHLVYYLPLVIPAILIVYSFRVHYVRSDQKKLSIIFICIGLVLELLGLGTVYFGDLKELYDTPQYIEKAMREFGVARYLMRDFRTLFIRDKISITDDEPEETAEPTPTPEVEIPHRTIDETAWKKMAEEETDDSIKQIDTYLLKQKVTDYNDITGLMEGKNLIYIMVEALDYAAIDQELTPTLWKMKEEGWDFTQHYTPKYSCTTGESEFIGEVSLVPESDVCTPNQYVNNAWPTSVFGLFEAQGYTSQAYHNWKDEFYYRRQLYQQFGCEVYKNYDDIHYDTLAGWQSDLEMIEKTIDDFIDQDKFMTLYVTSSMHFPYDQWSVLGERYLDKINQVHPDYPLSLKRYVSKAIEFDKSMEYLISRLEEAGKMDDTAIVFFADHHPLNMPLNYLYDATTELDRYAGMNEDRTPFIIYSPSLGAKKVSTVNSTFDVLPTVANLYNVDYDPRLYMGVDIFSDQEKLVPFPNGSWVSEKGIYYVSSDSFEAYEGVEVDDEYVSKKTKAITNMFKVSKLIYHTDYFSKREGIATPEFSHRVQ